MNRKKEGEGLGKERPLKGLKEFMHKNQVVFKEPEKKGHVSKKKLTRFKNLRKWDLELEKIEMEELGIKDSLKALNSKIMKMIERNRVKSVANISKSLDLKEQRSIAESLNKIHRAVVHKKLHIL